MANIDWTVLGLGALVGIGCREQLKACGRVAATTAASLAATAAQAAAQVAAETQSPEQVAAAERLERINQRIDQQVAGTPLGGNGQAGQNNGQNPNG